MKLKDATTYTEENAKILIDKDAFKPIPKLGDLTGNTGSGIIQGGTTEVDGYDLDFVIWRGDDKPTQAAFETVNSTIEQLITTANDPSGGHDNRLLVQNPEEELPKEYPVVLKITFDPDTSKTKLK